MGGIFYIKGVSRQLVSKFHKKIFEKGVSISSSDQDLFKTYDLIYLAWLFAHQYISAQRIPALRSFYEKNVTEILLESSHIPFNPSRFSFNETEYADLFDWYNHFNLVEYETELLKIKPVRITEHLILKHFNAKDQEIVLTHFKRLYYLDRIGDKEIKLYCLAWLWQHRMLHWDKDRKLVVDQRYADLDFCKLVQIHRHENELNCTLESIFYEYRLDELPHFLAWTFTHNDQFYLAQHMPKIILPDLQLLPFRIDSSIIFLNYSQQKINMAKNFMMDSGGQIADANLLNELVFLCYLKTENYLRTDSTGAIWVDGKRVDFEYTLFHENNTERTLDLNKVFQKYNLDEVIKILNLKL